LLNEGVEYVNHGKQLLAIVIRCSFQSPGIHFFTEPQKSQQLAFMRHPSGKTIDPHVHNPVPREVQYTQEVLFIRSGRVRVDFYANDQSYLESRTLNAGDVILLETGGHGFEILEDTEMIEVKQGPYAEDKDKTRFIACSKSELIEN